MLIRHLVFLASFVISCFMTVYFICGEKNISGNAETPFLLARVNELTGGSSLASNISLVKNNAAAKISVALAQLK